MKQIAGLFLIVASLVASLFFLKYPGDSIPYPMLGTLVSAAVFLVGGRLVLSGKKDRIRAIEKEDDRVLNTIRAQWIKIPVDYAKCNVKNYSFSYEEEAEHGRVAGMNVLSGDEMSNVRNVVQSQLLMEYPVSNETAGEVVKFQIPIYMDRESFDMRFIAGDIVLYADPLYQQCLLDFGDRQMMGSVKKNLDPPA